MFIGHVGAALAAKRVSPQASLGTLVAAALFVDLVWPVLLLAGVERVRIVPASSPFLRLDFERYPFTHSVLGVLAWAAAFGAVVLWRTGSRRSAAVVAALVASHWVLDFVVHRPDLPLVWSGPRVGLGLWRSVPGTLAVELPLFALGVVAYARGTRPVDGVGRFAFWGFVAFLLVVYAANVLGPPPPSSQAVGVAGLALLLLVAWAAWIDRHRATGLIRAT